MTLRLQWALAMCMAVGASACDRGTPPAPHPTPVAPTVVAVHDAAVAAAQDAAAHPEPASPNAAPVAFDGHAEGHGADPPIHEFAPRAGADAWSGNGVVHLEIPAGDGPVSGTIHMTGLSFAVRGRRVENRVTAVLDQLLDATSMPAASEPVTDSGPPEGVFRGALDGEIHGTALHATWEASATAGVHRRNGTLDATAAH